MCIFYSFVVVSSDTGFYLYLFHIHISIVSTRSLHHIFVICYKITYVHELLMMIDDAYVVCSSSIAKNVDLFFVAAASRASFCKLSRFFSRKAGRL